MEANVRARVHKIIDQIDDEFFLKQVLDWLDQSRNSKEGELWNNLSDKQRHETLKSLEESDDQDNLISQDDMKKRHRKWL